MLLDHDDYMPRFVLLSKANVGDATVLPRLDIPVDSIVVMDRAYNDYQTYADWTEKGIYFVTRLKEKTRTESLRKRALPLNLNIVADEEIALKPSNPNKAKAVKDLVLRKVTAKDPETGAEIVFLTNHLTFGPTTIAAIYKDRWQIEIFFKTLKQNLKLKSFVGTTENALATQIWTALIGLVLIRWLHHLSNIWLVPLHHGVDATDEPLHVPSAAALARRAL